MPLQKGSSKAVISRYRNKATCHPERLVYGWGFCKNCYLTQWRRKHLGQTKLYRLKAAVKDLIITPEEERRILNAAEEACNICGRAPLRSGDNEMSLHVDHDHDSKRYRGLLCGNCNRGIGMFKDRPDLLRAAATYLERSRSNAA